MIKASSKRHQNSTLAKSDLIGILSLESGVDKETAKDSIRVITQTIAEALHNGKKVELRGFGVLKVTQRAYKNILNPRTGEVIGEGRTLKFISFTPSKKLVKLLPEQSE